MPAILGLCIPLMALAIPIVAIILGYRSKSQTNKLKEMALQKELLELEIQKQNNAILLLDEENKKLDKIIFQSKNDIEYKL